MKMMFFKFSLGFLFYVSAGFAMAGPSDLEDCHKITDHGSRLECYDRGTGYAENQGEVPASPPSPIPPITWRVRNDGRYDGYFGEEIGSKNAELSFQRIDGKDFVQANIAVQAIFRPIGKTTLQPFSSARWQRVDSKKKKNDIRDFSVGLNIPLGDPNKIGVFLTPTYLYRTDIHGETGGQIFTLNGSFVRKGWNRTGDSHVVNYYSFIPSFGIIHEQRHSSEYRSGKWESAYFGFEWNAQWNLLTPRLQSTVRYQYFRDFSKPSEAEIRSGDYGAFSLSYEFTDPEDENVSVRPSIFIKREVGINPLLDADKFNQTTLGFGLKVN